MDELNTELNKGEGAVDTTTATGTEQKPPRVEKRIGDLTEKLNKETEEKNQVLQEHEQLKKKVADLEFKDNLNVLSQKYPYAKDFQDKIKEEVDSGLSLEKAALVVLGQEGKLVTADQIRSSRASSEGFGGSADTHNYAETKSNLTQEEKLEKLKEMERNGEIRLA